MKYIVSFTFLFVLTISSKAQVDSIFDQGTYRTFIVHLPSGYNPNNQYPLVLNFHGLGSSAIEQLLYSEFNDVADDEKFIVIYPDAINNSWDIFGDFDVTFVSNLIDTLRDRYSINNCLFSMGMSQGGFLSYKLACELDKPLSAIAVVTGGMTTFMQADCNPTYGLPVVHFHGTNDEVVPYEGTFGIPAVEETIAWWAEENSCHDLIPILTLPDVNTSDSSTVEKHVYPSCEDEAEVVLYKVLNGGHTWPGAIPIPSLGFTNQDINASEIIGEFFNDHCTNTTAIQTKSALDISIYPNPVNEMLAINFPGQHADIFIYNIDGQQVYAQSYLSEQNIIDCRGYNPGIYAVIIRQNNLENYRRLFVIQH